MTEHANIPFPPGGSPDGSDEGETPNRESSLFERARGAFGFDPFRATPIKGRLPDAPMKRAKTREPQPDDDPEPVSTTVTEPPLPARRATAPMIIDQGSGSVALSGKTFPIDRDHLREQGLIVPDGTTTALLEEFRIVKRRLLRAAHERGTSLSRRILVCSPHPAEGKTFCASNLAIAIGG